MQITIVCAVDHSFSWFNSIIIQILDIKGFVSKVNFVLNMTGIKLLK